MFLSILDSILPADLSLDFISISIILAASILIGLMLSCVFIFTRKKEGYHNSFPVTIAIFPVIVASIILLIGNNTVRALSLAGIFALTRFRSSPLETRDLAFVFLLVAVGISCGLGYIFYAIIFAIVVSLVLIVLYLTKFGIPDAKVMKLKIVVPENLNYDFLFDDILIKYCSKYNLNKVRTTDFGTMFELSFNILVKNNINQKEFIDELRTRNGNLNITLVVSRYNSDIY